MIDSLYKNNVPNVIIGLLPASNLAGNSTPFNFKAAAT
jgi:hypothetical protein